MTDIPNKTNAMAELGVAGAYQPSHQLKQDEFIRELRGLNAMRKYREMRENDPIVGAILTAMDMMIRSVDWKFIPAEGPKAEEGKQFAEEVFEDMEHSFEEFVSEVMSLLPYGFSVFENVFKRRTSGVYKDGKIGIKKLAPRAQYTIDRFNVTRAGEILGVFQRPQYGASEIYIPSGKMLLFRTSSINNDPSGRSVLRNAYISYHYVSHLQRIEAIAIEREMNGLPVGKVPASYMAPDADEGKKAFVATYSRILRDIRNNEQAFIMLPSDPFENDNGSLSQTPKVSFELVASKGTRDIDINKVINRHQQNIARTVLADFIMLGQTERGSFAMSKSKSDLFLRSIEGYTKSIVAVINRDLMPRLWALNGFNMEDMPKITCGNVAPPDLDELGRYITRIANVNENLFVDNPLLDDALLEAADLPKGTGDRTKTKDEGNVDA